MTVNLLVLSFVTYSNCLLLLFYQLTFFILHDISINNGLISLLIFDNFLFFGESISMLILHNLNLFMHLLNSILFFLIILNSYNLLFGLMNINCIRCILNLSYFGLGMNDISLCIFYYIFLYYFCLALLLYYISLML